MAPAARAAALGPGPGVVVREHGPTPTGNGSLLLLHGLANSSTVWHGFLTATRCGLSLHTADLPWRGDGAPGWDHGRVPPTTAVADALRSPAGGAGVVVAHSFSANLLLELLDAELAAGGDPVARYGIRGIVLVSPFYRPAPEDFDWASMQHFMTGFHRIMEDGIRVHARGRLGAEARLAMAEKVRDRVGPYGWTSFFTTYLATPWLRLDRVRVPCRVLAGADDFAAAPAESAALAARLPAADFRELAGCGHFLMSERPAEFAAAVDEFVTGGLPAVPHPGRAAPDRTAA